MFHNFYPEIASENSPANLITSFLHGDDPPGILVRVGVAVVLQVGIVPLYHHTELAALRTPGKAAELELKVLISVLQPLIGQVPRRLGSQWLKVSECCLASNLMP